MKMRSWSESSGAMLVPSTFTGWYKNTMITSAKPMAINRSRVHTRISLRKECTVAGRSAREMSRDRSEVTMEVDAGAGVSGAAGGASCFSLELSIFGCLVFIAWPSQHAPESFFAGHAKGSAADLAELHLLRFTSPR